MITSMPKSKNESYEESWWDIYQCLLYEKQVKEKTKCNTQASSIMNFVEAVAIKNQPKPIQSEVKLEKIIIETTKWEEEVESELNNVQSVNEKESELCLSEKMS